jgi:hypothetical protein
MSVQLGTLDNILAQIGPFCRAGQTLSTLSRKVAASTTIWPGDLVALDGSGNLVQALADPGSDNSLTTSSATSVYGIANEYISTDSAGNYTAGGQTVTNIDVTICDDNTGFPLRVYNATAANTKLSNVTIGTKYQFGRYRVTSNNMFYVLLTSTTTPEMQYDKQYGVNDQTTSDQYAIVYVHVVATYRQGAQ